MIKKVLIAGLFLGGGYYFINKILPNFTKKNFKPTQCLLRKDLRKKKD